MLCAHEEIFERFMARLAEACTLQSEWTAKVSASITAALAYMSHQPEEACMLILDSATGEARLAKQIAASQQRLAAILRYGRKQWRSEVSAPPLAELALVCAILAIVSNQLHGGNPGDLEQLAPQLIYLTLVPFIGPREAERAASEEMGLS